MTLFTLEKVRQTLVSLLSSHHNNSTSTTVTSNVQLVERIEHEQSRLSFYVASPSDFYYHKVGGCDGAMCEGVHEEFTSVTAKKQHRIRIEAIADTMSRIDEFFQRSKTTNTGALHHARPSSESPTGVNGDNVENENGDDDGDGDEEEDGDGEYDEYDNGGEANGGQNESEAEEENEAEEASSNSGDNNDNGKCGGAPDRHNGTTTSSTLFDQWFLENTLRGNPIEM